jgi:hypothetical protein
VPGDISRTVIYALFHTPTLRLTDPPIRPVAEIPDRGRLTADGKPNLRVAPRMPTASPFLAVAPRAFCGRNQDLVARFAALLAGINFGIGLPGGLLAAWRRLKN